MEYVSVTEYAKREKIGKPAAYSRINRGSVKTKKIGGRKMVAVPNGKALLDDRSAPVFNSLPSRWIEGGRLTNPTAATHSEKLPQGEITVTLTGEAARKLVKLGLERLLNGA